MANWGQFHMLFVSAARINRLDEILNTCTDHATRFANDSDYIQKCKDLYNLLDKACAKGDAHAKVHKYDSTQDGYAAWQALTTYYFADGNVKSYAAREVKEITKLWLNYNSPGGMDHYISQFQEHVSNLEHVKQPMAELLQ